MVARTRGELLPPLIRHYENHHAELSPDVIFLEGETGHFTIEQAPPIRCDLCCAAVELPVWDWFTPRSPDYPVEDEGWAVCDNCHPLVQAHDVIGLCKRIWEISSTEFFYDDERERKRGVRDVVVSFLSHVDPSRTSRVTLDSPRQPG